MVDKDVKSTKVITTQIPVPAGQEDESPKVEASVHFVPQSTIIKLEAYTIKAGVFPKDQVPTHELFLTGYEGLQRIRATEDKNGHRLWASMPETVREGQVDREVVMDDRRLEERRQEAYAAGVTKGLLL